MSLSISPRRPFLGRSTALSAVAVQFQRHRKAHLDALVATIEKPGGKPVAEKKIGKYADALKASTLMSQDNVLDLAARLAADETMHSAILNNALGRPLPAGALSFGA